MGTLFLCATRTGLKMNSNLVYFNPTYTRHVWKNYISEPQAAHF